MVEDVLHLQDFDNSSNGSRGCGPERVVLHYNPRIVSHKIFRPAGSTY